jgi:hypothetical protein
VPYVRLRLRGSRNRMTANDALHRIEIMATESSLNREF